MKLIIKKPLDTAVLRRKKTTFSSFRCIAVLLSAIFLITAPLNTYALGRSSLAVSVQSTSDLNLYAQAAVLMDADSGRILYEKSGSLVLPMASTTKIMTCIIALEYGNPEDVYTVSAYAASMPKVKLGVSQGETYRMEDLLYSLMLESHNDAAVIIAEGVSGSVGEFAALMNQKARDLQCFDTFFITPNGLDAAAEDITGTEKVHSTTAADLARIMKYCIMESPKKEEFIKITQTPNYSFSSTEGSRNYSCSNHNSFLSMMEGALSGKTGFTNNAGYCYVGALEQNGKTLIVALLACGWPNNKTYKWSDTRQLMSYGLENYEYREIFDSDKTFDQVPVLEGQAGIDETAYVGLALEDEAGNPISNISLKMLLREDEEPVITYNIPDTLTAPVTEGVIVGSAKYSLNDELIKVYPIVTTGDVELIDYSWSLDQVLNMFLP